MSTDINLVSRIDEESLRRARRGKVFNLIAIMFLVIVGLIAFIIFTQIKAINLQSIRDEQSKVLEEMSKFQAQQVKLLLLNNRVENIDSILNTRKNIPSVVDGLLAKIPENFLIVELNVDGDSAIVSGKSTSLSTIGELIDTMANMARKKEIIKSLTLTSLAFKKDDSNYYISLKSDL